MRSAPLLLLLLLVACANGRDPAYANRSPGLDVGRVALANGAPETALRIAQKSLALQPHSLPALILAANAQAALGQRDQSAHSFARALDVAPEDGEATLGLGRLQLANDPVAAAGLFLRATTRDPRNVAGLIDLGIASDLLGRHSEAQAAYRRALIIEPNRLAAKVNLGLSLALSGDTEQALKILRPLALDPGSSSRTRQNLAVALALAGSNSEAAAILKAEMPQPEVVATVEGYHALQRQP